MQPSPHPSLPSLRLAELHAKWLAPARARLLRQAAIHRRRRVVDLGAGWGTASAELLRRSAGWVLAVDPHSPQLDADSASFEPAGVPEENERAVHWLRGRAQELPLPDASCDLIFAQCTFLWVSDLPAAVSEVNRVLQRGGTLAAIEPDYGGLMEYPPEAALQSLWMAVLWRSGANPCVGRALPHCFEAIGLRVEVRFLDRLAAPHDARFDLLKELPLTDAENEHLVRIRNRRSSCTIAHLPYWLVLATKS